MGKAGVSDWNNLAWSYLVAASAAPTPARMAPDALPIADRGLQVDSNHQFPMLHTAAAVYAEAGKATEARAYILQAMAVAGMEEPEDNCWLVFGRIAEDYGLTEVARQMYGRVQPVSEADDPSRSSSYFVAQHHLKALGPVK